MKSQPQFQDVSLVIAGAKGWMDSGLSSVVAESGVQDSIHFLGYVSDVELNALMQVANIFAIVSFVEGFGIPVLEAMTVGTAVVASNTSAIPEVIGGDAFFCDPGNIESISAALTDGLTNTEKAQQFSERGFIKAQTFSWEITIRKIEQALIICKGSQ
jgi:glycosyltransferase involved in cell wall biosynthesis